MDWDMLNYSILVYLVYTLLVPADLRDMRCDR